MHIAAAVTLMFAALYLGTEPAQSEPSSCKQCADQQKACKANYSAATCKREYDLCMKGCRR